MGIIKAQGEYLSFNTIENSGTNIRITLPPYGKQGHRNNEPKNSK